jgi:UDP-3-O-[3-hydroxymyristoyl] glucosamine N-acyltransferase
MKFSELVEKLGSNTNSPDDPEITGVAAIDEATPGTISYIEGAKFVAQIATTQASALILPQNEALQAQATARGIAWVAARDPRLMFAQTIALFYQPFKPAPAIHPTAVIDPTATVGEAVHVGAHVVIQANVRIGNGVCIHPNVVVYPDAMIGDRTVLHANCVIHERSKIGADCVIHAGAVIGSEGFGFVPTREGWYKMEQSGCTVLEDGVEVGCNSAVDRPAVGETRIGRNTKLDNLVQVGHGCQIGEACALAAQIGVAGGAKIGNRVIMGGQVGVANQAKIGDGVQVGAQSGLHGNVQPGEVVIGTPAVPYKTFLKVSAIYSRLPEMYKLVKELQKRFHIENAESLPQDKS